jgi:uncharacterized protein (DUF1778 family)
LESDSRCISEAGYTAYTVYRSDDQRFIALADEKLTAFMELEAAIRTAPALNRAFLRNRS